MYIFNATHRNEGKLSIFTGEKWLELNGKHAAYIYRMNDELKAALNALEAISNFECTCSTQDVALKALGR